MTRGRSAKQTILVCLAIFVLALGVRFLSWQDNRREVGKVETYVTLEYTESARQLLNRDFREFISDVVRVHPPGYPIVLAAIFKVFGESNTAIDFFQMLVDSLAVVFVFLIADELLSFGTAFAAGALTALSPQFSYYSLLLLPDSLCVVPILVAVFFLIRAVKRPRVRTFVVAGVFVGISCWIRANALLLAPFMACCVPLLLKRGERLRNALAIVFGAVIVIAPITIKNAIVFHRLIPLSPGAGQKLLQGIAEYDQGRFDIPKTDLGIMRQEAAMYNRPDYALLLFGPDGIERDRWRLRRGVRVITAHPVWYAGVMARRGISFFRLARVPITAVAPPFSHYFDLTNDKAPMWTNSPAELVAHSTFVSPAARAALSGNGQTLRIESDETKYGDQIVSPLIGVEKHHDYLIRLPLKLEEGRVIVKVTDGTRIRLLFSENIDLREELAGPDQPVTSVAIPFVTGNESQVCVTVANNAPESSRSIAEIGHLELFELGPSSQEWMRYPRFLIHLLQRFYVTAAILPFLILGIVSLFWTQDFRALLLLIIVPAYYVVFQSALHTERRYVIAIHYFLLIIVATGLSVLFVSIKRAVTWFARRSVSKARA